MTDFARGSLLRKTRSPERVRQICLRAFGVGLLVALPEEEQVDDYEDSLRRSALGTEGPCKRDLAASGCRVCAHARGENEREKEVRVVPPVTKALSACTHGGSRTALATLFA
jgi:hypothetical protein